MTQRTAKPELAKEVGDSYEAIEKALTVFKPLYKRYFVIETQVKGDLLEAAIHMIRGADVEELRPTPTKKK